jgi:hypothetical protein
MTQDEQFRRTFDRLADRVLEDLSGQLKKIGAELDLSVGAEQERTVAEAVLSARTEAERQASEKASAAETLARETIASLEARLHQTTTRADAQAREAEARVKDADARSQEAQRKLADAEARLHAAEARIEEAESLLREAEDSKREAVAAAEARAHDAVDRAEALMQEAMASAAAHAREAVAAAEAEARDLLEAAEGRADQAARAATSRALADMEATLARTRAEASADALAASERMVTAVRTLDTGQTLSEIMNTLIRCAGLETSRVGIFVRDGANLRSWKLIGFDRPEGESSLELPLSEAGVIGEALQSGQVMLATPGAALVAPRFATLPPDHTALAVPLVISREVIGVLYADPGPDDRGERPAWASTIEILGRHATRALEVLTASKLLAQALGNRPAPSPPRAGTLGLR